jgi:hypothetical protein
MEDMFASGGFEDEGISEMGISYSAVPTLSGPW